MDMHLTTSSDAVTPGFVLDRIMAGTDTLVTAQEDDGRALLDAVAQLLARSRQRPIRVSVPADGLSLSGLMAAITGRRNLAAHDDAVLELGFRVLTAADETCDGTVLLISGADGLQRPALRYIQFAGRAAKGLRIVLAGTAALPGVLAGDELAVLRTRLSAPPAIVPAPVAAPREPEMVPLPIAAVASPVPRTRRVPGWAAAGLGMAASLALGLWIGRSGPQPPAVAAAGMTPDVVRRADAVVQPAEAVAPPTPHTASTQAAASPVTIPAEAAPRAAPPVAETPVQQATAVPVRPVESITPVPAERPADTQEAALPIPPQTVLPRARPARATPPRRGDTRTTEGAVTRRFAPTQPRNTVVARPPSEAIRLDDGNDGAPRPPRSWQPEDTFGPMYSSLGRPRSFIGTYSANPDGTRSFRMEP